LHRKAPPEIKVASKPEICIETTCLFPQSGSPERAFLLNERPRETALENTSGYGCSWEGTIGEICSIPPREVKVGSDTVQRVKAAMMR
jgi:hypothetical protein